MDKEKVVRIPITYKDRQVNEQGKGYVPCEVHTRWLQFPRTAPHERIIPVDVMTQVDGRSLGKYVNYF